MAQRGWLVLLLAAVVVALLIIAALYYFVLRPQGSAGGAAGAPAAQVGYFVPDEGRSHVAEGSAIAYQHNPPSSGPHYPSPEPWGVYEQPIAPGYFVHNLEHGGVDVLYDCPSGCPDLVNQVKQWYQSAPKDKFDEVKLVATPYKGLPNGSQVTFLAWDYEEDLAPGQFTPAKLTEFYNAHADQPCPPNGPFIACSPENIP